MPAKNLAQPPKTDDPRFWDWLRELHAQTNNGIGYAPGVGGAITQATSKATAVTLNKLSGQVTMNNAVLNAGAKVTFSVNNSLVLANDVPLVCIKGGGTANAYRASVVGVAAGSFAVNVENITAGNLSESPVVSFVVIKGAIT